MLFTLGQLEHNIEYEEGAVEHKIGINDLIRLLLESRDQPQESKAVLYLFLYSEDFGRLDHTTSTSEKDYFRISLNTTRDELDVRGIHYYDTMALEYGEISPQLSMYPIPPFLTNCLGTEISEIDTLDLIRYFLENSYVSAIIIQPRLRYHGDEIDCIWPCLSSILLDEVRKILNLPDIESIQEIPIEQYSKHPEWGIYLTLESLNQFNTN